MRWLYSSLLLLSLAAYLTFRKPSPAFSDPNVILIAALFIIGDGLVRTGVATVVGTGWLKKWRQQ